MLEENVVAHIVNKRPQAFRLAQALIAAQHIKDPRECFLANIVDGMGGLKARPELQLEQSSKICDKMLLCLPVSRAKIRHVFRIE